MIQKIKQLCSLFKAAFAHERFLHSFEEFTYDVFSMPEDDALQLITQTRFKVAQLPDNDIHDKYYEILMQMETHVKAMHEKLRLAKKEMKEHAGKRDPNLVMSGIEEADAY